MNLNTNVEPEELRAVAYKLLSTCYYLPEQEMLDQLDDLEMALSQICSEAAPNIASMRQETDLDRLKIEVRLSPCHDPGGATLAG